MNIWQQLPPSTLILAPMEGVTDHIFRQVVAKAGRPDLFFTEFTNVSSFASEKGRHNALERLQVVQTDRPIIAQIWGKNPEHFALLSEHLIQLGFSGLDINMGCPDRHVNRAGGGAAMIKTPELALECLKQARLATPLPVSIKTRLGFSHLAEYQTWIPLLLKQNLPALTVHLRTRKEMSKVPAHFELIPELIKLKNQISPTTKLIINGDIKTKAQAQQIFTDHPGLDGIMIGRGIFENPFLFSDKTPTQSDLFALLYYHLDLFDQANILSYHPFEPLKRFFKIYLHSFPGANDLRAKLMATKDTASVRILLDQYQKSLS